MDNTIVQVGNFVSTGANTVIQLRESVDWMEVYNVTQANGIQTTGYAVKFYWQNGFSSDAAWKTFVFNDANVQNSEIFISSVGFTYVDSSAVQNGVILNTITAISNASIPVVTNSGTNGLVPGSVVRLFNVAGAQQLGAMDFTVGYNTLSSTTFSLDYMPQIAAGTTGSFQQINWNPAFYPARRYITQITQAAQAVVTLSVTHQYQVGQLVRVVVPAAFGMVQMNNLQGTIVAVNTSTTGSGSNSITLDINSSAFSAFVFPLSSAAPFTSAEIVPIGEDTGFALSANQNILSDATVDTGYIGMILAGGANGPAGVADDLIFWRAGKAFSNTGLSSY